MTHLIHIYQHVQKAPLIHFSNINFVCSVSLNCWLNEWATLPLMHEREVSRLLQKKIDERCLWPLLYTRELFLAEINLRWILVWIISQVQNGLLDLLTCCVARYQCATAGPDTKQNAIRLKFPVIVRYVFHSIEYKPKSQWQCAEMAYNYTWYVPGVTLSIPCSVFQWIGSVKLSYKCYTSLPSSS